MSDLTKAEQAAAEALAGDSDCTWHIGCDEECHSDRARAAVEAVRPIIEAEVLDDAAEALAEAAAVTAREPYPTSQRLRFGLTSGAQRLRDRAEAARQSGEGRADG